jgi:hypothetical protein
LLLIINNEAGDAVLHHFRHRSLIDRRSWRVPHAIALIITRPNGSGQLIGNSRPAAFAKKAAFRLVDLADEPGLVLEVGPLHARHLAAGAIDCLPLASEITQTFLEQPCYRTVQGLDRIVDRLKKSLSELEPPTCERCRIDMRWFMSKLERQEPVTSRP